MIINKPENSINSLYENNEYLTGISSYIKDDNLNMINQLANELYRADLAPEIMEKFVAANSELVQEANTRDKLGYSSSMGNIIQKTNQSIKNRYSNEQVTTNKNNFYFNSAPTVDNSYYFLLGYQTIPSTKQFINPYYRTDLNVHSIRKDFPILQKRINGMPLVWLDNSATTQKPLCVINALNKYYSEHNSNIHRGAHTLAKIATNEYEKAREKVRDFIGASSAEEIIFVRGATEAINLVAETFGKKYIQSGDEIILTMMEHHSNIVPWQKLQQETGAVIKVIPINDRGEVILSEYEKLLTPRTKIVAITHVSNVLGTINPVQIMIEMAHKHGAYALIDGAQAVPHTGVNVSRMDADFYVFSGHKLYGPTGIGVLYGKKALLEDMPPWQRGGGMIKDVSFDETTFNSLPYKFEAGTGNIADAIGLGVAIDYIQNIGMENIERHEKELTIYAMERMYQIPGLHLIGTASNKTSVISFVIDGVSPDNIAQYLNQDGIAVRSGHHCAQPALRRYGVISSVRASLGIYNTREEVDCLANSVLKIAKYYY